VKLAKGTSQALGTLGEVLGTPTQSMLRSQTTTRESRVRTFTRFGPPGVRHPRGIQREGIALLLVEQNARAALAVSEPAYVLERCGVGGMGSTWPSGKAAWNSRTYRRRAGVNVHQRFSSSAFGVTAGARQNGGSHWADSLLC
jgi:hypothetical protein